MILGSVKLSFNQILHIVINIDKIDLNLNLDFFKGERKVLNLIADGKSEAIRLTTLKQQVN